MERDQVLVVFHGKHYIAGQSVPHRLVQERQRFVAVALDCCEAREIVGGICGIGVRGPKEALLNGASLAVQLLRVLIASLLGQGSCQIVSQD